MRLDEAHEVSAEAYVQLTKLRMMSCRSSENVCRWSVEADDVAAAAAGGGGGGRQPAEVHTLKQATVRLEPRQLVQALQGRVKVESLNKSKSSNNSAPAAQARPPGLSLCLSVCLSVLSTCQRSALPASCDRRGDAVRWVLFSRPLCTAL